MRSTDTYNSEELLKSYGFEWINQKQGERLVDAIPQFIWQKLKNTDIHSDIGQEILRYHFIPEAFNASRKFRLVNCRKFLNLEREEVEYPDFLIYRLSFELEFINGHQVVDTGFNVEEFMKKMEHSIKNKQLTKQETKELEEWIPGYPLKMIFQKENLKKQIHEQVNAIAAQVDSNLASSYHYSDIYDDRFYQYLTDQLKREVLEKYSTKHKLKSSFKKLFA